MQKIFLFLFLLNLLIFASCSGNQREENTEESNTDSSETAENEEEAQEEKTVPLKTREDLRNMEKLNAEGIAAAEDKMAIYRYQSEYNIKEIPKEVLKAKNLQTVELRNFNGASLTEEIGSFKNLILLCLPGADKLKKLPESIGNLKNLKTLDLGGCKALDINQVFEVIQNCENLEILSLSYMQFEELPEAIGKLKNLKHLRIKNNKELKTLPEEFYSLPNLETLRFGGSAKENQIDFTDFFNKLKGLPKLRHLDVMYSGLTALPESLKECKALKKVQWREDAPAWANSDAVLATTKMWDDKFPDFEVTWEGHYTPMYDKY